MIAKIFRLLAAVVLVASVACSTSGAEKARISFLVGSERVEVLAEIADDQESRAKGLSARESLGEFEGMLFVWDEVRERRFWMKDTLIPLDVIGIHDGKVVSVVSLIPCEKTPCVSTSIGEVHRAVEVNAGFSAQHRIVPGVTVEID